MSASLFFIYLFIFPLFFSPHRASQVCEIINAFRFPLAPLARPRLFNRFSMFTQHRCSMWRKTAASTPMETCESICSPAPISAALDEHAGASKSPQPVRSSLPRSRHRHMMLLLCTGCFSSGAPLISFDGAQSPEDDHKYGCGWGGFFPSFCFVFLSSTVVFSHKVNNEAMSS